MSKKISEIHSANETGWCQLHRTSAQCLCYDLGRQRRGLGRQRHGFGRGGFRSVGAWLRTGLLLVPLLFQGCMYANVVYPLDTDMYQTRLGTKVGQASSYSVLWLFAWGDSGVSKAAQMGELSTVQHLDQQVTSVLFGLYLRTTTIAYGD